MVKYMQKCVQMRLLVIIHVNPSRLCNERKEMKMNILV